MTDEGKAEEITQELICGKCEEIKHCKIIGNEKCINYIRSLNAILQGYKKGLAEGRKEKCLEQNNDGTIRPCEVMKENEILKNIISTVLDKEDICYICKMKGQVLPECMRMENSECLKNIISLWSK